MNQRFKPPRRVERQYERAINRLINELRRRLRGIKSPARMVEAIRGFARSPNFKRESRRIAMAMVTSLFVDGAKTWREAAAKGGKGDLIYKALKKELKWYPVYHEIIERNSKLIKSLSDKAAERASKLAAERGLNGERPESMIAAILQQGPNLTRAHARLIARTETAKAATALTRVRSEGAGISWYVWRTSDDARVRSSHQHMDDVVCAWNDPPSPEKLIHKKSYGNYAPGEIFNCRCYAEPLIDDTDVQWPHKVYRHGKIQYMTLAQFRRINQ